MVVRLFLFFWVFLLVIVGTALGLVDTTPVGRRTTGEVTTTIDSEAVALLDQFDERDQTRPRPATWVPSHADGSTPCSTPRLEPLPFAAASARPDTAASADLAAFLRDLAQATCLVDTRGMFCLPTEISLRVEGHTDDLRSVEPGGNQQLSFERALAVAELVMDAGFVVRAVEGFEATVPAIGPEQDTRSSAEAQRDNRRATMSLWCPRER